MTRTKKTMAAAVQTNAVQTKAVEVKKTAETTPVKEAADTCVKAADACVKAADACVKAKAEAPVKEAVKAEAEAPAESEKSVIVEFGGRKVIAKDVLAQAEKAFAEANPGTVIKTIELYISPEQSAAYYVVNGEGSESFRIEL